LTLIALSGQEVWRSLASGVGIVSGERRRARVEQTYESDDNAVIREIHPHNLDAEPNAPDDNEDGGDSKGKGTS
jgi:hypothetical protein